MDWEDISEQARSVMKELGNFGPTVNVLDRYVKGYTLGEDGGSERTYYDSNDLRMISASCIEVADWLDKRAETDEIESLRAENAKLKAELASARAEVEAYRNQDPVGFINTPIRTDEIGNFIGHGMSEISFHKESYGFDITKCVPLFTNQIEVTK